MKINFRVFLLFLFVVSSQILAENDSYLKIYDQIHNSQLDSNQVFSINNDTVLHQDLQILFQSGQITFFEPVIYENDTLYYGGYFEGEGKLQFKPSTQMERDQLYRFYGSDSLDRKFDKILLFFTPVVYENLTAGKTNTTTEKKLDNFQHNADDLHNSLKIDGGFLYTFEHLRNLIYPFGREFLLVSVNPENSDKLIYMFNPYLREEVVLRKHFSEPGRSFMEMINSYSEYNLDETYANINGRDKSQLDTKIYNINAQIDDKGILTCKTNVIFDVKSGPTQFIEVELLPSLSLDSIVDGENNKIEFIREKLDVTFKDWETSQVGILLNKPYMFKDTLDLTFYYKGKIAEQDLGELYIFAGADWYPRYGFRDRAIFNLSFKTDKDYTFTACGNKISQKSEGDYLLTSWKVVPEASNVSFNMGYMEKYIFEEEDHPPIDVFFSKKLHNEIATYLARDLVAIGKEMEKQIYEDVSNSVRLFNYHFGEYSLPRISVSEILMQHSEAFPGFLHLGFDTWINTDHWGKDRMLRSHETAHQWWGVGVGYETYHDKWLSEGFATYSSLIYLQRVMGNEKFLEKLKEMRNDIFSARKYLFGSGEESGPIALGTRTSSTETPGDYGLVIYKKGAFVLHMLRNMLIDFKTMNEDGFYTMLKEFYGSYRGKEASTLDFKRIAEKYTGIELGWFFNQWVNHNYLPECDFKYDFEQDPATGLYMAKCSITTKNVPDGFKMYMPLELQIDKNAKAYVRLFIDSNDFYFELPNLPKKPKKLVLNPFESVLAKINQ